MDPSEWGRRERDMLEGPHNDGRYYNVLGTLARNWEASQKLLNWAGYLYSDETTIPHRVRELVVLRTAWLCSCEYEWGQHVIFARSAGLTDEEIERVQRGPKAPGWSDFDAAVLSAADELHQNARIGDLTWSKLCAILDEKQMIDLVLAAGHYTLMSMAMSSFGTPLDLLTASESQLTTHQKDSFR